MLDWSNTRGGNTVDNFIPCGVTCQPRWHVGTSCWNKRLTRRIYFLPLFSKIHFPNNVDSCHVISPEAIMTDWLTQPAQMSAWISNVTPVFNQTLCGWAEMNMCYSKLCSVCRSYSLYEGWWGSTHWSPAVSECAPCSAPCSPTGWCCTQTSPRQTYGTVWSAGDTTRKDKAFRWNLPNLKGHYSG